MPNPRFKQLLKEGINSVANRQGWTVRAVHEKIGDKLGYAPDTVGYWKRGHPPTDRERVEFLVEYCATYGWVDKAWAQSFLEQTRHPDLKAVLDRLFPLALSRAEVYHNLPPRHSLFIGRAVEINRILAWLNSPGEPLASIEGMGGIGKTRLALEISHRCLSDKERTITQPFQAIIWISARDYHNFDLQLNDLLDTIAQILERSHLAQSRGEQKEYAVNKLLRRYQTLLIVDNFEI